MPDQTMTAQNQPPAMPPITKANNKISLTNIIIFGLIALIGAGLFYQIYTLKQMQTELLKMKTMQTPTQLNMEEETMEEVKDDNGAMMQSGSGGDITPTAYIKDFVVGKTFYNTCMSGELGEFKADGSLPISVGVDYVPNDDRSNKKMAHWSAGDFDLSISGSALSDGYYSENLEYTSVDGKDVLFDNSEDCGIVIADEFSLIDKFMKMNK